MCSWLSFASFRPSLTSEIVLKELLCKRQQMKCFHLTKNEHIAYFYEYLSKLLISSFYLQCIYHIHHEVVHHAPGRCYDLVVDKRRIIDSYLGSCSCEVQLEDVTWLQDVIRFACLCHLLILSLLLLLIYQQVDDLGLPQNNVFRRDCLDTKRLCRSADLHVKLETTAFTYLAYSTVRYVFADYLALFDALNVINALFNVIWRNDTKDYAICTSFYEKLKRIDVQAQGVICTKCLAHAVTFTISLTWLLTPKQDRYVCINLAESYGLAIWSDDSTQPQIDDDV